MLVKLLLHPLARKPGDALLYCLLFIVCFSLECTCRGCRGDLVKHDRYVLAAASMELGLVYFDLGMTDQAEKQLHSAKYVTFQFLPVGACSII